MAQVTEESLPAEVEGGVESTASGHQQDDAYLFGEGGGASKQASDLGVDVKAETLPESAGSEVKASPPSRSRSSSPLRSCLAQKSKGGTGRPQDNSCSLRAISFHRQIDMIDEGGAAAVGPSKEKDEEDDADGDGQSQESKESEVDELATAAAASREQRQHGAYSRVQIQEPTASSQGHPRGRSRLHSRGRSQLESASDALRSLFDAPQDEETKPVSTSAAVALDQGGGGHNTAEGEAREGEEGEGEGEEDAGSRMMRLRSKEARVKKAKSWKAQHARTRSINTANLAARRHSANKSWAGGQAPPAQADTAASTVESSRPPVNSLRRLSSSIAVAASGVLRRLSFTDAPGGAGPGRKGKRALDGVDYNSDDSEFENCSGGGSLMDGEKGGGTQAGYYNTVFRDWLLQVLDDEEEGERDEEHVKQESAEHQRLEHRKAHHVFESLDYELCDSKVWHLHKAHHKRKRHGVKQKKRRKIRARMLILILSVTVGAIGCFVTWTVEMLLETKLHTVEHFIEHHHHSSDAVRYGGAFGVLLGFNLLFALCAFLLVWTEPWSAGSGIPEMKCVLNGVNIPEVLAPRTIVCKVLGVIFGVSAGLPVGKEGPMIHAGGAVGAILTSMGRKSKSGSVLANFKQFDNDRDRRDFASIGTAAGVSAAFRTPIGGVLFVIEEGASFWSTLMTWRGFAASVLAVATVYLVFHGRNMFTDPLEAEDLFLFGEFTADIDREFHIYELAYFSFMAVMGGLVGAIFIHLNTALAEWRRQRLNGNPLLRGIEVFLVTALMTGLSFGVPYYLGRCLDLPTDTSEWSEAGVHSVEYLKPLNCDAETQYNDLATLFLNEPDRTIRLLFHVGDDVISSSACFIFATVFLAMECLTFGIWACSGLFIPSLLAGAAFGRGIGQVFGRNARTYSLVGAGCVLGGIARMTISITVILVEASGYVLFVIPLMCVFLLSRVVGNRFNRGVYDTQIEAKHLPFLEEEPPEETRVHNLRVSQLMSKSIKCVKPVETVKAIHELLTNTTHNCFPVLDADHGILLGTIMRKNLLVLLSKRHFAPPEEGNARMPQSLPVLRYSKLEESYPNYPPVESMHLTDEDMDKLCDLTAYVQIGPHVISEHASAQRAYMMFRTLGLRHLPVVNHFNEAVGIITRDNLLPEFFKEGGAYDPVHAKALAMPSN